MREIIFKFELFLLTFRLSAELHGEAVVVGAPLSEPDDVKIKLEKKLFFLRLLFGDVWTSFNVRREQQPKNAFLFLARLHTKNIGDKTEGSGS